VILDILLSLRIQKVKNVVYGTNKNGLRISEYVYVRPGKKAHKKVFGRIMPAGSTAAPISNCQSMGIGKYLLVYTSENSCRKKSIKTINNQLISLYSK
jgi:hypothetical protein